MLKLSASYKTFWIIPSGFGVWGLQNPPFLLHSICWLHWGSTDQWKSNISFEKKISQDALFLEKINRNLRKQDSHVSSEANISFLCFKISSFKVKLKNRIWILPILFQIQKVFNLLFFLLERGISLSKISLIPENKNQMRNWTHSLMNE